MWNVEKFIDGCLHFILLGPHQNRRPSMAPKRGICGRFCHFVYNTDAGSFMGRTGFSWLEIILFYITFYCFLLAFWAVCCAGFIYTLDDSVPRFYGKGTIIGINPGMGYQPWIRDDPESTLIYIKLGDEESYKKYVDVLDRYLHRYMDKNMTRVCTMHQSNLDDVPDACEFDVFSQLGQCSPHTSEVYGYPQGKPCVILSLNRLIGWRPLKYPDGSAPSVVGDRYNPGDIAIYCHGKSEADEEHILDVKYYPQSGIQGKYYPYKVMANYQQPIAAVKFDNIQRDIIVQVECLAYAYNIIHDPKDRQGLIHFELFIQSEHS